MPHPLQLHQYWMSKYSTIYFSCQRSSEVLVQVCPICSQVDTRTRMSGQWVGRQCDLSFRSILGGNKIHTGREGLTWKQWSSVGTKQATVLYVYSNTWAIPQNLHQLFISREMWKKGDNLVNLLDSNCPTRTHPHGENCDGTAVFSLLSVDVKIKKDWLNM